jgi:hypothetical protein
VARTSASDTEWGGSTLELRRAAVTLAVVAAHAAVIFVMWRGAGNSAEVLNTTLIVLPITSEDRPREPARVSERLISRAAEVRPRDASAARASATAPPHVEGSLAEHARSGTEVARNKIATGAGSPSEPAAPVDWYAEARASADALEQGESIERERRSLAGPKQHPSSARHLTPACPFEKCEPNWGADFDIFESQHTKRGRIEKIPDDIQRTPDGTQKTPEGEVILWINNWCYETLVTGNKLHRGAPKCFVPLGKRAALGDLFKHMNESPAPEERATDIP